METMQPEWNRTETVEAEGPSLDFIRAVANLLETNPDDILAELGYVSAEESELVLSEH